MQRWKKENVNDPNFDSSAIDNIKTSLMGPLAGIGDSFFGERYG